MGAVSLDFYVAIFEDCRNSAIEKAKTVNQLSDTSSICTIPLTMA